MSALMSFAQERIGSLISKKVGAAVVGEVAIASDGSIPSGLPTIIYIIAQALVDAARAYGEAKGASS
jgi:ABC-type thiamin/hydroxymethylpyrimidine transport system permease subunit